MKLINRYLIRRLSSTCAYVLLALLALYGFLDLLKEIGDVGTGSYSFAHALLYTAMQMPARAYLLLPLAVLIGALLTLAKLSGDSELAVIKTSGVSTGRIIGILLKFGCIFAIATAFLGEWLAPELSRRADMMKATAEIGQVRTTGNGIWIKQNNSMMHVAEMLPDGTLSGIKIWQYDRHFKLEKATIADKAQVLPDHWLLHNVRSSEILPERVHTEQHAQLPLPNSINRQMLNVLLVYPEQMSARALGSYIGYLEDNRQQTQAYRIAFWNKIAYPVATVVMAIVALAFTPQGGRQQNIGLKLVGGIALGLLFHFSGQFLGHTGKLYGMPAPVSAFLPTIVFLAGAVYLIRKQEKR